MNKMFSLAGLVIALCVVMGTACQTRQPEPVHISPEFRRALDNLGNMVGPVETPDDKRFGRCYDSCFESCPRGATIEELDEYTPKCEKYCRDECRQSIQNDPEAYK